MKQRQRPPPLDLDKAAGFFGGLIPDGWFSEPVQITYDEVEILVVGRLPEPSGDAGVADDADDADDADLCAAAIRVHRESTKEARIAIAAHAETRFRRKVAWGTRCGDVGLLFTHLSVPAMTRLRLSQRLVLDTLVDAGVARSRSDALSWCVTMVERNLDTWLEDLRGALTHVEEARSRGPEGSV